jgi:hypothetical protein
MKLVFSLVFVLVALSLSAMADIQVTYTNFTSEQQTAFEYAVSLWEPILNSAVPIKINARFQNIPGFVTVLIPNMIYNFSATPMPNVWYSNALANALTGIELNPGEADMDLFIVPTPDHPWYYGIEGNCPAGSYDFITEMHKAVAYGLGYMSSFYVQSGYGSYGMLNPSVLGLTTSFAWEPMQNYPALYDTHICNTAGQYLTDTSLFTNPSTALNAQLTGNNLRYEGQFGNEYAGGEQPVLYASSFNLARTAKLSSTVYNGTENAPGIPTGALGTVYRYPAPIVLGILKDQGWSLNLESLCQPPANLSASVISSDVTLNWEIPVSDYSISNIHVFRNGAEIAVTDQIAGPYVDTSLAAGSYEYCIKAQYSMGLSPASESITAQVSTSVEDDNMVPLKHLSINLAPNPVNSFANISLKVDTASEVRIEVYDLKGRKLSSIFYGMVGSGEHIVSWNAADSKLASGVYLLKASSVYDTVVQKILLVK